LCKGKQPSITTSPSLAPALALGLEAVTITVLST
jgi:hypothetical protein